MRAERREVRRLIEHYHCALGSRRGAWLSGRAVADTRW